PPHDGVGAFESQWCLEGITKATHELGYSAGNPLTELQSNAPTNAAAKELLDSILRAWATAIVSTVCVLDPQLVLLSGLAQDLTEESFKQLSEIVNAFSP